jgi:hypothetical protein
LWIRGTSESSHRASTTDALRSIIKTPDEKKIADIVGMIRENEIMEIRMTIVRVEGLEASTLPTETFFSDMITVGIQHPHMNSRLEMSEKDTRSPLV